MPELIVEGSSESLNAFDSENPNGQVGPGQTENGRKEKNQAQNEYKGHKWAEALRFVGELSH